MATSPPHEMKICTLSHNIIPDSSVMLFPFADNQLRHQELHAGNAVISSVLIILNDIVDIDEIGEDITAEICEEIDSSNPHLRDPSLASTSIALKPDTVSSTGSRYAYVRD